MNGPPHSPAEDTAALRVQAEPSGSPVMIPAFERVRDQPTERRLGLADVSEYPLNAPARIV